MAIQILRSYASHSPGLAALLSRALESFFQSLGFGVMALTDGRPVDRPIPPDSSSGVGEIGDFKTRGTQVSEGSGDP